MCYMPIIYLADSEGFSLADPLFLGWNQLDRKSDTHCFIYLHKSPETLDITGFSEETEMEGFEPPRAARRLTDFEFAIRNSFCGKPRHINRSLAIELAW